MINSKSDFRHTQVSSGPNRTMNNQFPSFLCYLKYRERHMQHAPNKNVLCYAPQVYFKTATAINHFDIGWSGFTILLLLLKQR